MIESFSHHLDLQFKNCNQASSFDAKASKKISSPFSISLPSKTIHQNCQSVHWNNLEKQKYSIFICYFRELLKCSGKNESKWNVFRAMSKFIKTRNPQQCRSYHLKLIKQFKGINEFICMVVNRIPKLKQKIVQVQDTLTQIQNEFDLFINQNEIESTKNYSEAFFQEKKDRNIRMLSHYTGPQFKEDIVKTSDSYQSAENNLNFSFLSNQSQFKPFNKPKPRFLRSELPSFGDNEEVPTLNPKNPKNPNTLMNFPLINTEQSVQQNFFGFNDILDKDKAEKMKDYLECQYLFQLWTSKLEKIMRK